MSDQDDWVWIPHTEDTFPGHDCHAGCVQCSDGVRHMPDCPTVAAWRAAMSGPHIVSEPNRPHPIDRHLESLLLRQRGQNGPLAREVLACLSPEARERLFRVLQGTEQDAASERSKRRRGQFW